MNIQQWIQHLAGYEDHDQEKRRVERDQYRRVESVQFERLFEAARAIAGDDDDQSSSAVGTNGNGRHSGG